MNINTNTMVFDKVISLGTSCQVAYQLNRKKLRFESYPFDWLFSSVDSVICAIDTDFNDWLSKTNLVESNFTETTHRRVTDTKYNTIHQHIFPLDQTLEESYNHIKEIVDRRVQRFLELKGKNKQILFIGTNYDVDKSIVLGEIIEQKYGENALLLVVNHTKNFTIRKIPSTRGNILIYEIYDENENTGQRWEGHNPHWDQLLFNIKVKKEIVDLANNTYFEGFYPLEQDSEQHKFRWSGKEAALHVVDYGGYECSITLVSPIDQKVTICNCHNEKMTGLELKGGEAQTYSFHINHETRCIKLLSNVWRPCKLFHSNDTRELGVMLKQIWVERQ